MVKIIAGIVQKDSGEVKVLDFAVPSLEAMKDIGYMAQRAALYSILTGRENLEFFGKMYGLKKEELQARIAYIADLVDLTEELDKKVINYSGGMLQRLSLAVALVAEPKVLILDEPTVGIDLVLRKEIWKELYQLAEAGIVFFFVFLIAGINFLTERKTGTLEKCYPCPLNGEKLWQGI